MRVGLLLLEAWGGPNPRHVDQGNGIHFLLLLVTMLDDETAAVMRTDEGLREDNCLLPTSSECSFFVSNNWLHVSTLRLLSYSLFLPAPHAVA